MNLVAKFSIVLIILGCPFIANAFPKERETRCEFLLSILKDASDQGYIGEQVSQLEHGLQCAYFATEAGGKIETVVAALFHDIGHLCADANAEQIDGFGIVGHDKIGGQFLRSLGMTEKVCLLVEGHVEAKRYLASKDPNYYDQLSEASKVTLTYQGGLMTPKELAEFEKDPLFQEKILIRRCDEKAKCVDLNVPGLETYQPHVLQLLQEMK